MDETHVIGELREIGHEVGDNLAAFTSRFEFPERLRHFADRSLERHFRRIGRSLAMMFVELRLEVPGIEMAHRSRAKNDQHLIRLRRVMRDTRSVGT